MPKKRQDAPGTMAEKLYREALELAEARKAASAFGRLGGRKGGPASQALRSPAKRRKLAQRAGEASWKARTENPEALAQWKAEIQAGRRAAREAQRIAGAALDEMPAANTDPEACKHPHLVEDAGYCRLCGKSVPGSWC